MEDRNFVVYAHYTLDTNELFYVGEGRPDRAYRKNHRNRYWKFKVAKHGFKVVIVQSELTKLEAEAFEKQLIIEELGKGTNLTNMSVGPLFENHWLVGKPKELHPRYGVRFEAPWIAESNRRRKGLKLKPRPDLSERNRTGVFRRKTVKVMCVETGQVFDSVASAAKWAAVKANQISKVLSGTNKTSGGYTWKRVT